MEASRREEEDRNRAREQAQAQAEGILELVAAYEIATKWNDMDLEERIEACKTADLSIFAARHDDSPIDEDDAQTRIDEDPLSVEVREGWHTPGNSEGPDEFMILLCTGGPACRLLGNLSEYHEPESVKVQYQDWFTPWEEYPIDSEIEEKILTYCRQFYFGE